MKNTCLLVHCISSFEGISLRSSYKEIQDTAQSTGSFISCCFKSHQLLHEQISFFTSFQNLIQHFLEKEFCHKFSFLMDSPKPATPLGLKSAKLDETFLLMVPKFGRFLILYLGCSCATFNFTTQMTFCTSLLINMPMNKKLEYKRPLNK